MDKKTQERESKNINGYTEDGQKYEDVLFSEEKNNKISLKEAKNGLDILKSHGKVFYYFMAMVLYFFIVELMAIIGWIPSQIVPLLILPVIIAILVLKKKYNDEKNNKE